VFFSFSSTPTLAYTSWRGGSYLLISPWHNSWSRHSAVLFFGHDGIQRYVFSNYLCGAGSLHPGLFPTHSEIYQYRSLHRVLYIFSFAASILILDRSPHGLEEFKSILNGNIIWVEPQSVLYTFILYFIISIPHIIFRKRFLELSRNGNGGFLWEFCFLPQFCNRAGQVRPDGRHPSGVRFPDHPCSDRAAFHSRAHQSIDHGLAAWTCFKHISELSPPINGICQWLRLLLHLSVHSFSSCF